MAITQILPGLYQIKLGAVNAFLIDDEDNSPSSGHAMAAFSLPPIPPPTCRASG